MNSEALEAAAKAHCDFFGGEGWWDTGILADKKPKAIEAMRRAIAAWNTRADPIPTDDSELLTIAWMDGSHRSTKAHRDTIKALEAEVERLREALERIATVDMGGGFLGAQACQKLARTALEARNG